MEPLLDGEDFAVMAESVQEAAGLTDRLVRIKRHTGWTGGALDGLAPSEVFQYIDLMMTIESVTPQEVFNSGGMLTLGDVTASGPVDLREKLEGNPDTGATAQEADVLLFEGYNWYMTGKVERWVSAGQVFSRAKWRRT